MSKTGECWSTLLDLLHCQTDPEPFKLSSFIPMPKQYNFMLWWNTFSNHFNLFHHTTFFFLFKVQKNVSFHDVTSETTCLFQGRQVVISALSITAHNRTARIRHQCRKTIVLSCHRCLFNTGVEKMNNI